MIVSCKSRTIFYSSCALIRAATRPARSQLSLEVSKNSNSHVTSHRDVFAVARSFGNCGHDQRARDAVADARV